MTMNIVIIGAAGFIGRKLTDRLLLDGKVGDTAIDKLLLADVVTPELTPHLAKANKIALEVLQLDITSKDSVQALFKDSPSVIFHLAAVVSGDAEENFHKGYQVNVDGTRLILEAITSNPGYTPRLVFTSSLAVYGPPIPDVIPDHWATTPCSSYGTQKAIGELLVKDYTRKGYVDGISIRFPTITIRPGKPNAAASSFISGMIREPLHGQVAKLPVRRDLCHFVASPQAAVGYLLQAATMTPTLPGDRTLQMPGLAVTMQEMINALERIAGPKVTQLIQHEPDPFIMGIVENWPKNFQATRALELGFVPDRSYDDIIVSFMKDEGTSNEK